MQKTNYRVIYSLRVKILLQKEGFYPVTEMQHPKIPAFSCWVYEVGDEFLAALDRVLGGVKDGR